MLGLGNTISKASASVLQYVKDNLKLYLDFKSNRSDTLAFPSEGSTSFDGNDYISLSALSPSGTWSIAFWFKASVEDNGAVYTNVDGTSNYISIGMWDGHIQMNCADTGGVDRRTTGTYNDNKWHHAVLIKKDTSTCSAIYIDGVLVGQDTSNTWAGTNSRDEHVIGRAQYGGEYYWNGSLSNLAIWNRELEPEEIQSVMNKSYSQLGSVEKTSLVSWWALDSTEIVYGSELWDADASSFDSGTYSWVKYNSNNGMDNDSGVLKISRPISNADAKGAYVWLKNASDLSDNLIVGATYKFTFDAKVNSGSSVEVNIGGPAVGVAVTETSFTSKSITFIATNSTINYVTMIGMDVGEIIWLDNFSLKPQVTTDSKNNNDGIIAGATTTTSVYGGNAPILPRAIDIAESFAEQIGNGSALFNGSSDYVDLGNDSIFSFASTKPFSISAWVYYDTTATKTIIGKGSSSGSDYEWRLFTNGSSHLNFALYNPTASAFIGRKYSSAITTGSWHHISATYDGGTACSGIEIYLNGIAVSNADYSTGSFSGMTNNNADVIIGEYTNYFDGKLSQIGVWLGVLSQEKIQSVMESTSYAKIPADVKSTLSSELVTTISAGTNWSYDSSAETLTASGATATSYTNVLSGVSEGDLVKLSFDVTGHTGGSVYISCGGGDQNTSDFTNGSHAIYLVSGSGSQKIAFDGGTAYTAVLSNISVKEVTNDLVAYYPLDADSSANGVTNDVTTGETLGSNTFVSLDNFASNNDGQVSVANNEVTLTIPTGDNVGMNIGNLAGFGISSSLGYADGDLAKISFEAKVVTNASGFGNTLKFKDNQGNVITNTDITLTTEYQTFTNYYVLTTVSGYRIPMWYRNASRTGEDVQKFKNFSIQKVTSNTGVLK